jgi:hypothetical protein
MAAKVIKISVVIYRLKVSLVGVRPPIWRKVLMPARITLDKLHLVIQAAMGWENRHLHQFRINGQVYCDPEAMDPISRPTVHPEKGVELRDLIKAENEDFLYIYDFSDEWRHEIKLEKILMRPPDNRYPTCVQGRRRCPPEDCGGPPGYDELLAALADARHPGHQDMLAWLGPDFDPAAFDLDQVNQAMIPLQ